MVQHNDKWKKKATREYHRKHGTLPIGRGRGRRQQFPAVEESPPNNESETSDDEEESENDPTEGSDEKVARKIRPKYGPRRIESNAWRFESEETGSDLSTPIVVW